MNESYRMFNSSVYRHPLSIQAHGIVKRQRSNRQFVTKPGQGTDAGAGTGQTVWTGVAHIPVEMEELTDPTEKPQHGDPGHPLW